ncbi:MAG: hypothetical protein J0I54_14995 [Bosea sp.]|uniref:hypothetical protein n=1 Tax=unclassified Bosea (in: a-proteobacteria) TaxID=2653178 RepID=UPI000AD205F7|nr:MULTISPECIES: hypothetical protein [unclassified Bosea (in: a-proteobacteria)]MBN9457935.1 hypothetical protein [Bosea sp. (in: a-proteobacteria)]
MRQQSLQTITKTASALGEINNRLLQSLNNFTDASSSPFNLKKIIPNKDSSTADVISRIFSAIGLVNQVEKSQNVDTTPLHFLVELNASIAELISSANNILSAVDNVKSNGGLNTFNYDNFYASSTNGNSIEFLSLFQSIFDRTELLLERTYRAIFVLRPKSGYSFQSASSAITTIVTEASDTLKDARNLQKQAITQERNISEKQSAAESALADIIELKDKSRSSEAEISSYLGKITNHISEIDPIVESAKRFDRDIASYTEQFVEFQKKLDSRNQAAADGETRLRALISALEAKDMSVDNLIEKSTQMLSSATVSGLASNFDKMQRKLTSELFWARSAFYAGILILIISSIPLIASVTVPIAVPFLKIQYPSIADALQQAQPIPQNVWQYLSQIFSRIAILIPAAWLVSFAAIRHSSLFRLREHYAYKYSMAVAVEGFKKQAPEYEQEIAALVLEQLAFNPTDKLIPSKDIKEGKAPGLIAAFLLEKIRKRAAQESEPTDRVH